MFTIIEKKVIGQGYAHTHYRLILDGDFSDYNGATRSKILDTCDINNFGGVIETCIYNPLRGTTSFIIKIYID